MRILYNFELTLCYYCSANFDEEFDIEVAKGRVPLGLEVRGGTDTKLKDVVIKEIVPYTPADIDGQLRPEDQIIKVPNV